MTKPTYDELLAFVTGLARMPTWDDETRDKAESKGITDAGEIDDYVEACRGAPSYDWAFDTSAQLDDKIREARKLNPAPDPAGPEAAGDVAYMSGPAEAVEDQAYTNGPTTDVVTLMREMPEGHAYVRMVDGVVEETKVKWDDRFITMADYWIEVSDPAMADGPG